MEVRAGGGLEALVDLIRVGVAAAQARPRLQSVGGLEKGRGRARGACLGLQTHSMTDTLVLSCT